MSCAFHGPRTEFNLEYLLPTYTLEFWIHIFRLPIHNVVFTWLLNLFTTPRPCRMVNMVNDDDYDLLLFAIHACESKTRSRWSKQISSRNVMSVAEHNTCKTKRTNGQSQFWTFERGLWLLWIGRPANTLNSSVCAHILLHLHKSGSRMYIGLKRLMRT